MKIIIPELLYTGGEFKKEYAVFFSEQFKNIVQQLQKIEGSIWGKESSTLLIL